MSIVLPVPISGISQQRETTSRTYKLDLEKGRIAGMIDGLDAVNQFIRKALITPRFKCMIYSSQYGSEIRDTILSKDVTPEYIKTELPRQIEDTLMVDKRILRVYNIKLEFQGDAVLCRGQVDTVFGPSTFKEMI